MCTIIDQLTFLHNGQVNGLVLGLFFVSAVANATASLTAKYGAMLKFIHLKVPGVQCSLHLCFYTEQLRCIHMNSTGCLLTKLSNNYIVVGFDDSHPSGV